MLAICLIIRHLAKRATPLTRDLWVCAGWWAMLLVSATAWAQPADPDAPEDPDPANEADPLAPYRARVGELTNRTIGSASRPVVFNWRDGNAQLAATGSLLLELNNYNTARVGALLRVPQGNTMLEFGATWAAVGTTDSARLLALTPYRQPGRPSRIELDFTVGTPLAEGLVTARPRFFPATQLVFNVYAGLRYVIYPTGWGGLRPGQVATNIVSPTLSQEEIDNLEPVRPDGMEIDPGRYGLLVGFGNDMYIENGLFLSPRVMFAVPLLEPLNETRLLFYADLSLSIGMAF